MRLKKKGLPGPKGEPADLFVTMRIVVPKTLDEESRALIEEFARLNPGNPRD
jgi:DnaJ-class molecular chaperone